MADEKGPRRGSLSIQPTLRTFTFEEKTEEDEKLSPQTALTPESLHTKPWPARPQTLHKELEGFRWWDSTVDFVMLLMPMPFFILIAATIAVNGKKVDPSELSILDHSIKGSTTLFPIFFAAATGRAAVKYATWKLEQGTTLGTLEQLMGSRTVASTFTTQVQLRSFNVIGVVLLVVWSLSPIGGQSVLHILYTPAKPTSRIASVGYFNSRQQSYSSPTGVFSNQWFPGFAVVFGSTLLSPLGVKESSMDIWGNVKIPYYSSVLSAEIEKDSEGWTAVTPGNSSLIYSSLFGLPLSGISIGNTTFTVESTYLELSCGNVSTTSQTTPDGQFIKSDLISTSGPWVSFENVTVNIPWAIGYRGPDVGAYQDGDNSSFVYPKNCPDCLPLDYMTKTFDPGSIVYQEFDGLDNSTAIFCTPSQQYIESAISCAKTADSQTCEVTAQRLSLLSHMPSTITPLSFPRVALGMTALLQKSTPEFGAVNLIENYIYNPTSGASIISTENSFGNSAGQNPLESLDPGDFSDRFGQLINAYLFGSMWNASTYLTGASFDGITANLVGGNNASFVPATSTDLIAMIQNQTAAFTVPATLITSSQVYFIFYPWLLIFLLATVVMLLASIVGVFYSRRTIVPDYLGFVSSLAKESPYIRMPDVGVNMDGMDKARLVKDVNVRLGDVSDVEGVKGQIGRLAFARMEETVLVRKGKLYI